MHLAEVAVGKSWFWEAGRGGAYWVYLGCWRQDPQLESLLRQEHPSPVPAAQVGGDLLVLLYRVQPSDLLPLPSSPPQHLLLWPALLGVGGWHPCARLPEAPGPRQAVQGGCPLLHPDTQRLRAWAPPRGCRHCLRLGPQCCFPPLLRKGWEAAPLSLRELSWGPQRTLTCSFWDTFGLLSPETCQDQPEGCSSDSRFEAGACGPWPVGPVEVTSVQWGFGSVLLSCIL